MLHAIDNERVAIENRLNRINRVNALTAIQIWRQDWLASAIEAQQATQGLAPELQFYQSLKLQKFDSALVRDADGHLVYPDASQRTFAVKLEQTLELQEAERLDFIQKDKLAAAAHYLKLIDQMNSQAQTLELTARVARCEFQAGLLKTAYDRYFRLSHWLSESAFESADAQVKRIVIHGVLRALEISAQHNTALDLDIEQVEAQHKALQGLANALNDYKNYQISARERVFFMDKALSLADELSVAVAFPTLVSERFAQQLAHQADVLPEWFVANHDDLLIRLRAKLSSLELYVRKDKLEQTLQEQLIRNLGVDTVVARLSQQLSPQPGEETLVRQPLDKDFAPGYVTVSLPRNQGYSKSLNSRRLTYYLSFITIFIFVSCTSIYVYRNLKKQQRLNTLRNDALATIAHELKTPLTSIRILVDTLIESPQDFNRQTKDYLQIISQEHIRLNSLVENFLTFSRLERGRLHFAMDDFDLNELVSEAFQLSVEKHGNGETHIALRLFDQPLVVHGDQSLIFTVILNLLDNAIKYSDPVRKITLATGYQSGQAMVEVEDNGHGLSVEDQKKVFNQYFRAEQELSRSSKGCGLGLHISRKIAEAHQGNLEVQSVLGKGSLFVLVLPCPRGAIL